MSDIIDFYCGQRIGTNDSLREILKKNNDYWEDCHDFIQWLFPLNEYSNYNHSAPILKEDDITQLQELFLWNPELVSGAVNRFMNFLGFEYNQSGYYIVRFNDFYIRVAKFNHNHLRITRLIKFLKLVELDSICDKIYLAIQNGYLHETGEINHYWYDAYHNKGKL